MRLRGVIGRKASAAAAAESGPEAMRQRAARAVPRSDSVQPFELAGGDDPRPQDIPLAKAAAKTLAYQSGPADHPSLANRPFARVGRDAYLPVALVLASIGVGIWSGIENFGDFEAVVVMLASYATVKALVTAVFVWLATRHADVSFGMPSEALVKLAAVAVFPDAVCSATFLFLGDYAGVFFGFPLGVIAGWSLFVYVFDMDLPDANACTLCYGVVALAPWILWYHLIVFLIRAVT